MKLNSPKTSRAGFVFLIIIIAGTILWFQGCVSLGGHTNAEDLQSKAKQSHFSDGRFYNDKPLNKPYPGFWFIARKFMFSTDAQTPNEAVPIKLIDAKAFHQRRQAIRITWLGHSSILLEMENKRILFDPVFSQRASPFQWMGPKRFHPVPVDWLALPELDAIVISHDHYDHLDYQTIVALAPRTRRFIVPLGVAPHLLRWGIKKDRIIERDWWQGYKLDNLELVATPAQHFSGRRLSNRNATLWVSWAVLGERYRVYFSGDTGMFDGFNEIGKRYGPFDYTLMHIGAYVNQQEAEEYTRVWNYVHMTPEEAVQAHKMVKGKTMLPIHWGTFRLAFHGWDEPAERMMQASQDIRAYIPMVGQWVEDGVLPQQNAWWKGD